MIYIAVTAARPLVSAGWMEFQRDWKPYYFDAMIERLGLPPYAYLFPMSLTESAPGIVMVLFYPERGINVTYTFRDSAATQSPGEFCFDLGLVQELKLSLYAPDQVGEWASYVLPPELNSDADPFYAHYTWQAQTGQDFASFYEDYQASGRPCIGLERSLSSR